VHGAKQTGNTLAATANNKSKSALAPAKEAFDALVSSEQDEVVEEVNHNRTPL